MPMPFDSSHRDDVQLSHSLEVSSIVGEQREAVVYGRRANQEIEVIKASSGGPQSSALQGKDPANGIVERYDFFDVIEKTLQPLFRVQSLFGAKHPVIEFGERYDAQSDA